MLKDLSGRRFLVVDDEDLIRDMIADDLEMLGATVFQAPHGEGALQILAREKVDMVISDIRMPKMDGVDLLKKIREVDPHIPLVIMITGFSETSPDEVKSLGAVAVFQKPIDRDQFLACVAESSAVIARA